MALTYASPILYQVLKLELKQIREQQDLLFRFMNFLKQEGAVHVLQICLTVGEAYLCTLPKSFLHFLIYLLYILNTFECFLSDFVVVMCHCTTFHFTRYSNTTFELSLKCPLLSRLEHNL